MKLLAALLQPWVWRLAWRAYKAGRYDEALAWLEREEAAVPHDDSYASEGQVPYFRGRALEKLGRLDEARRAFARYLELAGDAQDAHLIRARWIALSAERTGP